MLLGLWRNIHGLGSLGRCQPSHLACSGEQPWTMARSPAATQAACELASYLLRFLSPGKGWEARLPFGMGLLRSRGACVGPPRPLGQQHPLHGWLGVRPCKGFQPALLPRASHLRWDFLKLKPKHLLNNENHITHLSDEPVLSYSQGVCWRPPLRTLNRCGTPPQGVRPHQTGETGRTSAWSWGWRLGQASGNMVRSCLSGRRPGPGIVVARAPRWPPTACGDRLTDTE